MLVERLTFALMLLLSDHKAFRCSPNTSELRFNFFKKLFKFLFFDSHSTGNAFKS